MHGNYGDLKSFLMNKPVIKLFFTDFWDTFNIEDNLFLDVLKEKYSIELSESDPDFLIYSLFGIKYQKYKCVRISFIGENIRPNFNECDYSFNFDYSSDPRNFRLPLYALFNDVRKLLQPIDIEKTIKEKTKFCNFIYSNPGPKERKKFFKNLCQYKKVDSAGKYLNNTGRPITNKLEFIKNYKFTIAYENSSYPGYTTEKIFEPFLVRSIPIYWGNPLVKRDFNAKAFLNRADFESDNEMVERIIEIDNDDKLFAEFMEQPPFLNNELNEFVDNSRILERFVHIFNSGIEPVALKSKYFSPNPLASKSSFLKFKLDYELKKNLQRLRNISLSKLLIKIKY